MQTTNFPARKPLTVYFDYACPYCFHGVSDLLELLKEYPYFSVTWVPCEAHPLPEPAWVHSGLAGQAMLAVSALGGNVENFHEAVFFALFREKKRIGGSRLLASHEDVLLSKEELAGFLRQL